MPRTYPDFTGNKFGKLTALYRTVVNSKAIYLCRCDCGVEKLIALTNLTHGNTTSCGCFRKEACRTREHKKNHPTHGVVLAYYKRNCKLRNIEWKLTLDEFTILLSGNCFYCNIEPQTRILAGKERTHNGIDRVDSSKGYVTDNVVTCCKRCNQAKNDMTIDEFIDWLRRIHAHFLHI